MAVTVHIVFILEKSFNAQRWIKTIDYDYILFQIRCNVSQMLKSYFAIVGALHYTHNVERF